MHEWFGLLRSFAVYWRPGRQRALRRLYRPFLRPGDLAFDVGAHLGDRAVAFAALGARVVALEPQPLIERWLRRMVGGHASITVRAEAVGRAVGVATLAISRRTPTVSSVVEVWRDTIARTNRAFARVRWDTEVEVPVVTLDRLIDTYGVPRFCKIDVEGAEADVLSGLTHVLPALSFEFMAGHLESASDCVRRLEQLGAYEFNAIAGEGRRFLFGAWRRAPEIAAWLEAGAGRIASGDIYARLVERRPPDGGQPDHAGREPEARDG